jgi:hypothetical protein
VYEEQVPEPVLPVLVLQYTVPPPVQCTVHTLSAQIFGPINVFEPTSGLSKHDFAISKASESIS